MRVHSWLGKALRFLPVALLLAVPLHGAPPAARAASGFLSVTRADAPPSVDLTAIGTVDWAHWQSSNLDRVDHKFGVKAQIGTITILRRSFVHPTHVAPTRISWKDGNPTRVARSLTTAIYVSGVQNGFALSLPAGPTTHTLRLYVGATFAHAVLSVNLSDGTPGYQDAGVNSTAGNDEFVYTITYRAATAGQHLTVRWLETIDHGRGVVFLQAAALR
jgi:hypothetical protein